MNFCLCFHFVSSFGSAWFYMLHAYLYFGYIFIIYSKQKSRTEHAQKRTCKTIKPASPQKNDAIRKRNDEIIPANSKKPIRYSSSDLNGLQKYYKKKPPTNYYGSLNAPFVILLFYWNANSNVQMRTKHLLYVFKLAVAGVGKLEIFLLRQKLHRIQKFRQSFCSISKLSSEC